MSTLSIGLVNYNFPKAMKNNYTEFVEHHLTEWMLDYYSEELAATPADPNASAPKPWRFVHKDPTPECLFKQCDADAKGRGSFTEVVCHDELAAFAEQFGLMGANARADEKKHRQSSLKDPMGRGRISREKLDANASSAPDLAVLHRARREDVVRGAALPG